MERLQNATETNRFMGLATGISNSRNYSGIHKELAGHTKCFVEARHVRHLTRNLTVIWCYILRSSIYRKSSKKDQSSISILPALWKTFGGSFLFGWLLKLAVDVITFMLPQLLSLTIGFIDSSKGEERPEFWKGLMYACLLFVVASLQTLMFNHFFHRMYNVGFRIRTALMSAIYRKALVVSNATRKESTIGEITNLMSIDAGRFTEIMLYIDLVWSAPLQIAVAMYFLWSMLGPAVLAGLAVMLVSMPITGVLLNMTRICFTKQMANKDERIKMMNEVLNGIKVDLR